MFQPIKQFTDLVDQGVLVVINHSGGKDSQATYNLLKDHVPADQLVVVHADLGRVEWLGTKDHIINTIDGRELHVAKAIYKDGSDKDLLDMVRRRGKWPSSAQRYCTSDLKRGPCEKVIRRLSAETGRKVIISCFGSRAEESPARAKRPVWSQNKRQSVAGRSWYEYNPIHDLLIDDVFRVIAEAGQEPHWCYANGNDRMSCVFCIFGSKGDIRRGAQDRPELAQEYIAVERETGHTFRADTSIEDIIKED